MIPVMRVRPKPDKADLIGAIAGLHLIQAMQCVAPDELARIAPRAAMAPRRGRMRRLETPEATAIWHLLEAELCRDHKEIIRAGRRQVVRLTVNS
ncbi:hypothetical protein D9M72_345200 [compost metagenome]